MKLALFAEETQVRLAMDPALLSPRRRRSSRARVSGRACPRGRPARRRDARPARSSRKNVCDERLRDLPAGGLEHGDVRRDEHDALAVAVLRGEPLEQRVGVGRVPHRRAGRARRPRRRRRRRPRRARPPWRRSSRARRRARAARRTGRRAGGCSRRRGRASRQASRAGGAPRRAGAAAATLTFSDSTAPASGIETSEVARPPHERAQPLALGAEDERGAAGEVGLPHRRRRRRARRRRPRGRRPSPRSR